MQHPVSALDAICQQLPALAHLPLQTTGAVFMGFPNGHPKFVKDFLDEVLYIANRNCCSSRFNLHNHFCSYFVGAPVQRLCIWLWLWKKMHNNLTLLLRTIWLSTVTLTLDSRQIRNLLALICMLHWDTRITCVGKISPSETQRA